MGLKQAVRKAAAGKAFKPLVGSTIALIAGWAGCVLTDPQRDTLASKWWDALYASVTVALENL